jgi:hypothetical protein
MGQMGAKINKYKIQLLFISVTGLFNGRGSGLLTLQARDPGEGVV